MSGNATRAVRVDLNADLGETAGTSPPEDEAALMESVTSASIACGLHAGGPDLMRATVELAAARGVAVGAHPGFADRAGFGRHEMSVSPREVETLVAYQIGALAGVAALFGVRLQHVKPHGALYNMAARDRALADAVARATRTVDGSLVLFGLSGSRLLEAAAAAGLRPASEVFADRAYRADGSLVPRGEAGAVIHDADVVVARAIAMVREGAVAALDGSPVPLVADTICVHGDTPGAARLAARIRAGLSAAGVAVRPVAA